MYSRTSTSVCMLTGIPCLFQIRSTLSDLDSSMIGSTAVACLLVREGADPYCKGGFGESPLEICQQQITSHVLRYTGQRSDFIGYQRSRGFSRNEICTLFLLTGPPSMVL